MSNKPPLTGKELQEKISSGETKVVSAKQDETEMLRPYVMIVLEAVGHPEAWVSDESSVGDFRPVGFSRSNKEKQAPLSPVLDTYQEFVNSVAAKLGIGINKGDYIIDIAMRLKALEPYV